MKIEIQHSPNEYKDISKYTVPGTIIQEKESGNIVLVVKEEYGSQQVGYVNLNTSSAGICGRLDLLGDLNQNCPDSNWKQIGTLKVTL